jgi:hypothetical protein
MQIKAMIIGLSRIKSLSQYFLNVYDYCNGDNKADKTR